MANMQLAETRLEPFKDPHASKSRQIKCRGTK
jgi:hypothetical protein